MSRRKKSAAEKVTSARIGSMLEQLRKERGWTIKHVSQALGFSVSYVHGLEGGAHTFSASLIEQLGQLFQRPLSTFLSEEYSSGDRSAEWQLAFGVLPDRDRLVLLDLAKRMTSWDLTLSRKHRPRHEGGSSGRLVALEGIDGEHLHSLGSRLAAKARATRAVYCPHDYRSHLWRHVIEHSAKLDSASGEHRALERTLMFACERLLRNASQVQPALTDGKTALAPFVAMAPGVYQEVDGTSDRRITDIVETLLPRPDAVVVLRSDPVVAARKVVGREPRMGQFYSPYDRDQLARAVRLYEKAIDDFRARGVTVHVFDAPEPLPASLVDAVHQRIFGPASKSERS